MDHKRGSTKGVPVKLHYDDNRRVTLERRDYFYAPLPGTPFGLAVAIPNYGTTWIKVIRAGYRAYTRGVYQVAEFQKGAVILARGSPSAVLSVLEIVRWVNLATRAVLGVVNIDRI